jgi:hypothetical protein
MNAGLQVRPPSVGTLKNGIAESCEPTATTVSPETATLLNAGALTRLPDTLSLDTGLAALAAALAPLACAHQERRRPAHGHRQCQRNDNADYQPPRPPAHTGPAHGSLQSVRAIPSH